MKNQKNVVNNIEVVGESKQLKVATSSNLWKGANEHDDHDDTEYTASYVGNTRTKSK